MVSRPFNFLGCMRTVIDESTSRSSKTTWFFQIVVRSYDLILSEMVLIASIGNAHGRKRGIQGGHW